MQKVKRTRDADRTTRALLDSARREFAGAGYQDARTATIAARANLTRGALYHHYRDKLALFTAVVEEIQAEIAAEVTAAARAETAPLAAMRAGCARYLDCCARSDVRQIVLIDGPAALGWETWQAIDERHAFGATRAAVRAAIKAGELPDVPDEPLTRVLLGVITHAGLDVGRSSNPRRRRRELGSVIDLILDRLSQS